MEGKTIPTDIICDPAVQDGESDCRLFFQDTFRAYDIQYYILISGMVSNRLMPKETLIKDLVKTVTSFKFSDGQIFEVSYIAPTGNNFIFLRSNLI